MNRAPGVANVKSSVTLDFGLLTLEAGASPLPRFSLDAWPDIVSSQEVLGSPDAQMRKVMQRFENSSLGTTACMYKLLQ